MRVPLKSLSKHEKLKFLNEMTRPVINIDAIFSDETENYASPAAPNPGEPFKVRLRAGKNNLTAAYVCSGGEKRPMSFTETLGNFDYYECEFASFEIVKYYFIAEKNDSFYYYNKNGVSRELDENYNFCVIPGFSTPNWAKGAVMYQIYVDRFFNGDPKNDVADNEYIYLGKSAKKIKNWNEPVEPEDICNFYGGDLKGIIDKLDYLKDLGVEAIYLNPVFVSPSNHKYDAQDYDYVDPHIGVIVLDRFEPLSKDRSINRYANMYVERATSKVNLEASNQLMIRLIELAHQNNIKIILDGVFNHCGAFNKWLDREGIYYRSGYPVGAYRDKNSKYRDYFRWYDDSWPNNECYDAWWGYDNHPKLNFEGSRELYDYILGIGAKWVSPPFNADGWRLDVAADLGYSPAFNHKFWRDFRASVKKANPNAIILAEHYGDPKEWLSGDQWDTVMNYDAFMEPLTWFLTGMEKHSEDFRPEALCDAMGFENTMRYFMARFNYQSLYCAMNELSNHDHSRFLTRTNKTPGRLHTLGAELAEKNASLSVMMEAVTFQMTWPGAPTVYYGDEVGLAGWTDPDNRRPFPWGKENKVLLEFHKRAIATRKKSDALRVGSADFIYSNYGILCYGRWTANESVIIIINNNAESKTLTIPVWKANVQNNCKLYQLYATVADSFISTPDVFYVRDGQLLINVPPFSSIVLGDRDVFEV